MKKLTTVEFISKAKLKHWDKYDYSKVEYTDNLTPVSIICPIHGEFQQKPVSHLSGKGCPKCGLEKNASKRRGATSSFIEKAKKVHGNKYDYSKVEYIKNCTKVSIICPQHGEFRQTPLSHISGHGCPMCGYERTTLGLLSNTKEFIEKAVRVHGEKYDYSKVKYTKNHEKVCIICPEHGEFWQAPADHLSGKGCPNCHGLRNDYKFNLLQEFKDEYALRAFLMNGDINILQVILSCLEEKYEPLKDDLEKALRNAETVDPIQALEEKYSKDTEEEDEKPVIEEIDPDDDDSVDRILRQTGHTETRREPTIEEVIRNTEAELQVINRIEHSLTPEVREYIMQKFLNDKRRLWIENRESNA